MAWNLHHSQPIEFIVSTLNRNHSRTIPEILHDLISFPNVDNCTVTKLKHYKDKQSPYHEFILFVVDFDYLRRRCTIHIKIERVVKDLNQPALYLLSSRSPPRDAIWVPGTSNYLLASHDCDIVDTLTFSSPPLPLEEFSLLLSHVTNIGKHYHVLKHQCYWFCWIIKEACIELWRGKPEAGPAKHLDGRFAGRSWTFGIRPSKIESRPSKFGRDRHSLRRLLNDYHKERNLIKSVQGAQTGTLQTPLVSLQREADSALREGVAHIAFVGGIAGPIDPPRLEEGSRAFNLRLDTRHGIATPQLIIQAICLLKAHILRNSSSPLSSLGVLLFNSNGIFLRLDFAIGSLPNHIPSSTAWPSFDQPVSHYILIGFGLSLDLGLWPSPLPSPCST